ncbi:hypothetical protein BGZ75_004745 [Mortierella antarctica]|nr:hypothetical protein BGZ75_004745 [Mortierella antarctica]
MKVVSVLILALAGLLSATEARLTVKERLALLKESDKPDYCSACLRKGMNNHFPHACLKEMPDPIEVASKSSDVPPDLVRCICLAFMNPSWMTADCAVECEFAKSKESMAMIPKIQDFPGCEAWVDLKTITELEVEGWPKRDPNYTPEVYPEDGSDLLSSLQDELKHQQEELDSFELDEVEMDGKGDEEVVDKKNKDKDEL